jgi:hypothetical protein
MARLAATIVAAMIAAARDRVLPGADDAHALLLVMSCAEPSQTAAAIPRREASEDRRAMFRATVAGIRPTCHDQLYIVPARYAVRQWSEREVPPHSSV